MKLHQHRKVSGVTAFASHIAVGSILRHLAARVEPIAPASDSDNQSYVMGYAGGEPTQIVRRALRDMRK